jgi:hypothetical protein
VEIELGSLKNFLVKWKQSAEPKGLCFVEIEQGSLKNSQVW